MRIRLRTMLLLMIPIALFCTLAAAARRARITACESSCDGRLHQMAIGLLNYRDRHGRFPGAAGTGPLQSWRVLVYAEIVGSFGLDRTYNLAQPWNSAGNLPATRNACSAFVCPNTQGASPRYANYVALVDRGVSSLDRVNAESTPTRVPARRILVVEYPNSDILWTEPRDLDVADLDRLTPGADPKGLGVIFSDCRVDRLPLEEIRRLLGR